MMGRVHEYKIRARYSEIDGMKLVHNSIYQIYFEEARIDLVRSNDYAYEKMEKDGIMFPVSEVKIKYLKSIFYDELVTINVTVEYLKNFSFKFNYKIFKEDNALSCEGYTIHPCIDKNTGDFIEISDSIRQIMEQYLED